MIRARIIPRAEIEALQGIDALRAEAERVLADARDEARRLKEEALREARERSLANATRAAARVIAEAESAAEHRMRDLEPLLAGMVARTVAEIVGDMDRGEAVERATSRALERLRDHRRSRIAASPDAVEAVRRAVARVGGEGAEVLEISADDRLAPGRVVLTSDAGHAEIGLSDLVDEATRPFGEAPAEEARGT